MSVMGLLYPYGLKHAAVDLILKVVTPLWDTSAGFATQGIVGLKRDGPCAETKFRLSEKRISPFESAGVSD
jgi:hypothetical protein